MGTYSIFRLLLQLLLTSSYLTSIDCLSEAELEPLPQLLPPPQQPVQGYLFTMPGTLQAGATEQFCLTLHGITKTQTITVSFSLKYDKTGSFDTRNMTFTFNNGVSQCRDFDVMTYPGKYDVILFNETSAISKAFEVQIQKNNLITLVQTDKPIFKPGQLVKFRILTLLRNLRARKGEIESIFIMDPNNLRVKQFKNVASDGIASLEFQLISEPKLGSWFITVTVDGEETKQGFEVAEYGEETDTCSYTSWLLFAVLPRFEVNIQSQSYFTPTTEFIEGNVCAKYTYGKPVKGFLTLNFCARGYSSFDQNCAVKYTEIEGCYNYSVNISEVLSHYGFSYGRYFTIEASVREADTGVQVNKTIDGPRMATEQLKISFSDSSNNYFKPGLPVFGRVKVEKADGSPAPGEEILIAANDHKNDITLKKTFKTDVNGEIFYYICHGLKESTSSLSLTATALSYKDQEDVDYYRRMYQPRGYASLKQWFSPSLSYIKIPARKDSLKCRENLQVNIPYTHDGSKSNVTFYYQVLSRGRIILTGEKESPADSSPLDILELPVDLCLEPSPSPPPTSASIQPPPTPESDGRSDEPEPSTSPVSVESFSNNAPLESMDGEQLKSEEIDSPEGRDLRKKRFVYGNPPNETDIIVRSEVMASEVSSVLLDIPISAALSPKFSLLVFYIRDDGEVVADSMDYVVEPCFENEVKMQFSDETVLPGAETKISLSAAPGSLCSIGVVDKSVNILGGDHQITPETVFKKLGEYSLSRSGSYDYYDDSPYCKEQIQAREKKRESQEEDDDDDESRNFWEYGWWYTSEYVDAIEAFKRMGFAVLTNLNLETRPCKREPPVYYEEPMTLEVGLGAVNGLPGPIAVTSSVPSAPSLRSYFPETWLWDLVSVGETGMLELKKIVPHTITKWVGNSLCTSGEAGLGVSPLISLTAFQPFFLAFNLPYAAVRGERLPITITVYNYLDKCLNMLLTVDGMTNFKIHSARGNRDSFCLCGGQSSTKKFYITAQNIGKLPIFAGAEITSGGNCDSDVVIDSQYIGWKDSVQREIFVKAEGVTQQYSHNIYMCVEERAPKVEQMKLPLPNDMVEDSARGEVTVVGDIMGPALNNLDGLVRMPTGCGEQNMVGFTPNIYVLKYLNASSRLTNQIQDKAKFYMETGYQRELKYRHNDGSFSAFGESSGKSGSTWLTAFVVQSFAQARPYIYIDDDDLEKSISYLRRVQGETGCFIERGQVFSSYMQGGLGRSNSENKEDSYGGTLTAYVLISLLQAGIDKKDSVTTNAIECINRELQRNPNIDTYSLALAAYAHVLYDQYSHQSLDLMSKLNSRAVDEGSVRYWKREGGTPEPVNSWYYYAAPSAEVEMTAYALLATILFYGAESVSKGQPIGYWLSSQQSAFGGYSSTQDTVVGLNALSEFATSVYFEGPTNMTVIVEGSGIHRDFQIQPVNSLELQIEPMKQMGSGLRIQASGSGCALVQANVRYNKLPSKLGIHNPKFELSVAAMPFRFGRNRCDRRSLVITFGVRDSETFSTGMTMLTIHTVSSWSVIPESLRELSSRFSILGIDRYEVSEQGVITFYLDQLDTRTRSFSLDLEQDREMAVSAPKPAEVQIYEYYERDMTVIASYTIKTTCGTKLEIPYDQAADRSLPFPEQARTIRTGT
ncbi:murinoglobulin-1-like isoform X5 [Pomacea canaliculata]|uniref:murinoglobulin-1-like isoform X5 n=1 Tax=Pomacea canaliculata TaxID=400727 RepID=UPI000D732895|nr:murinoglobulin-1-like isoform X5 [Pomacea canaliculata]